MRRIAATFVLAFVLSPIPVQAQQQHATLENLLTQGFEIRAAAVGPTGNSIFLQKGPVAAVCYLNMISNPPRIEGCHPLR